MSTVRLWTPESEYDIDAIEVIARKIVDYYGLALDFEKATKATYNQVMLKPKGLEEAVNIYLKKNKQVIFLIDADSQNCLQQRRKQLNSYYNKIEQIRQKNPDKVKLIIMLQELEAWLLVDCLALCSYFTKEDTRSNHKWQSFTRKKQSGATDLITEPFLGGKSAKEHLSNLSKEILSLHNSKLKPENLNRLKYSERKSHEIARYMEINTTTINRNQSLADFAKCLKQI